MHNPQDPTHTQDLRLTGHSEVLLRYGEYSRYVESVLDQAFGKIIITNVELSDLDDVTNEEELYELLILLFGEKAIEFILEEDERAEWFLALLGISYFRGRIVAENQLKPTVVSNPAFHARKLRLVNERSLGTLTKNVNQMILSITSILQDQELLSGDFGDLKRTILEQIDRMGTNAANRTVRTELIYANQVATVFQGDLVEQETGVEVVYRWQTREDSIVRDTHQTRNNKIYSREAVTPLLGEANCRCAIHPVTNGEVPPAFNMFNIRTLEEITDS